MDKHCILCEGGFYSKDKNICKDSEVFVDKNNIKNIVCRYSENAIPFNDVYKEETPSEEI